MDKLKTAHRKLGGGRAELWSLLINHFKALIASDKARHEDLTRHTITLHLHLASILSRIFASALVSGVSEPAERARRERKVAGLLPLAMLPEEEKKSSPAKGATIPQLSLSLGTLPLPTSVIFLFMRSEQMLTSAAVVRLPRPRRLYLRPRAPFPRRRR